jgi:hypothetical protein
MSPAGFAKLAQCLLVHRWRLAGTSIASFFVFLALFVLPTKPPSLLFFALAGPMTLLPWALFCVVAWFHPQTGSLQPNAKLFSRLPGTIQTVLRWYGAIFLSLFVMLAAVVWPALVCLSYVHG